MNLSSSAKAHDPVLRDPAARAEKPRRTGCPAFAGYDGGKITAAVRDRSRSSPSEATRMKIMQHPKSHLVKLNDGSTWQIFPGDIDLTLQWLPTTELRLFEINDEITSYALVNSDDGSSVRVRPLGERWPADKVKNILKSG